MPKSLYEMLMGMTKEAEMPCTPPEEAEPGVRPEEEPFKHPWPTIDALSSSQRRWYLWWKNSWVSGRVIDTYPDYIALLAHEMASFIWNPDPEACLEGLTRLADDFAKKPNAGKALLRWAGDLAWELNLDMRAYELYSRGGCSAADGIRVRYIELSRSTEEVNRLIIPRLYPSTHLVEHRRSMLKLFREAFIDGDHYFRTLKGVSLTEALGRRTREHLPYMGLKVSRSVSFRTINAPRREDPIPMLTGFLKAIENLHREASGNKARLKAGTLSDEIREFIKARSDLWPTLHNLRNPAPEIQDVKLRKGVVARLHKESIQVSQMAEEWLGPEEEYTESSLLRPVENDESVSADSGGNLSVWAVNLLRRLLSQGFWSEAEAQEWCRSAGRFLAGVLDEINESSLDILDCPLVILDGGNLVIDSDFISYAKTLVESETDSRGEQF